MRLEKSLVLLLISTQFVVGNVIIGYEDLTYVFKANLDLASVVSQLFVLDEVFYYGKI